MLNKAGKLVQPNAKTFAAAAAGADWSKAPGFGISLNNQGADEAWPITSASFILMYKKPENPGQSLEVLKFFRGAFSEGQDLALSLDYVPLPEETVAMVLNAWNEIVGSDGKPILK